MKKIIMMKEIIDEIDEKKEELEDNDWNVNMEKWK